MTDYIIHAALKSQNGRKARTDARLFRIHRCRSVTWQSSRPEGGAFLAGNGKYKIIASGNEWV
jgi:hypothetical protein